MSSTPFSVELRTESNARHLVLGSGVVLNGAGILVILSLPLAAYWRWPAALAWGLAAFFELRRLGNAYRRYRGIRIDATGAVQLRGTAGGWMPAELLAGSVALPRVAWLWLRLPDGTRCGELLRRRARESEEWRRFRLVWRHLGGAR